MLRTVSSEKSVVINRELHWGLEKKAICYEVASAASELNTGKSDYTGRPYFRFGCSAGYCEVDELIITIPMPPAF